MELKIAKVLSFMVVLLITFDLVGAAITACPISAVDHNIMHSKKPEGSLIGSLLLEKAEEENEKTGEEKEGCSRIVIADFSHIAISLSLFHTPHTGSTPRILMYDVRPPVYALHCVFII